MAKLKDVAQLAGVSIAAVSLYVNGKSKGRISKETQRKIEQALADTGYEPPSHEEKEEVKSAHTSTRTVLIFWSISFRRYLLGSLLTGIQNAVNELSPDSPFDFVIRPYSIDELYRHKRALCGNQYHAAMIVSASAADIQFLESITPQIPIVLVNRKVDFCHCVYIDSTKVGEQTAHLIREKGYSSMCIIRDQSPYMAINSRFTELIRACREQGIQLPNEFQIITNDSISHGEAAAKEYLSLPNRPPLIFTGSDSLAFGILRTLRAHKVSVPGQCGVLSFGFERPELAKYSEPPLSVIDISTSALAYSGMQLVIDVLKNHITMPSQQELSVQIRLRSSF